MEGKGITDDIRQIGVVTKYEILKHLRSRRMMIFIGIVALLFILITVLSFVLDGELPKDQTEFMETYLTMVDLMIILGVSLFCASTIAAEFEERTALLMFPRPMRKTSFFIGKMSACYIICGGVIAMYYGISILLSFAATGGLDMNTFSSLGIALMFMFGAGGFALLMSSIFKKGSIAVIVTIAVLLLVFNIVDSMLSVFGTEPIYSILYASKDILNYISGNPNVISYDFSDFGVDFTFKNFYPTHVAAIMITSTWAVITTTLSAFIFGKKEF
jgi:ABC-2 type transport system permease protein